MNIKITAIALLLATLMACTTTPGTVPGKANADAIGGTDQNDRFDKFKDQFLDEFWSFSPDWATYVGYYKYDDKLIVPDDAARSRERVYIQDTLTALAGFEESSLSVGNATDLALIRNQLESGLWYQQEFQVVRVGSFAV